MNLVIRIPWLCIRFSLGIACLGLSAWLLIPPLIYPTSQNAVVNAWVVPIRNNYAGEVTMAPPEFGTSVQRGRLLARVEDRLVSRRQLATLEAESLAYQDQLAALERQHLQIKELQNTLRDEFANYKSLATVHLETQKQESLADLRTAEARLSHYEKRVTAFEKLHGRGATSLDELLLHRTERDVWANRADQFRAVLARNQRDLEALQRGVFLQWGTGSPFSQSRQNELEFERLALETQIRSVRARLVSTQRQCETEKQELQERRLQEFRAPLDGVVWRRLAQKDAQLDEYADLLQLISPHEIFVEAAVGRAQYDLIKVGDQVEVRIHRRPFLVIPGRVAQKLGAGAELDDRQVASELAKVSEHEFRVQIELQKGLPGADASNFYHVGRRVYVRFKTVRWDRWGFWNG